VQAPSATMLDELSRRTIFWAAVLAGVLILGYAIIARYRRNLHAPVMSEEGLLEELRAAHDAGELDTEEYRRVRETIARQSGRAAAPKSGNTRAATPRPASPPSDEAGPTESLGEQDA